VVLRPFSPARAWRPAVIARLARTLGLMETFAVAGLFSHPIALLALLLVAYASVTGFSVALAPTALGVAFGSGC
jgi:hypothetical protein